ncbi:MAG TPA: HAD family hydrolase, partial [Actinobacteria bacterium]|nr:HAD family hydrolase [Actinomycetota bacterium]
GLVMVANTAIGIVQELRAKRQLEQLAVVTAPTAEVIRERRKWSLPVTGIVQDDLVSISTGAQLAVDGVVEQANGLEVDESLLTGESDPVTKLVGDQVLSGSFVVAGAGLYTATGVGADAYAARLADEAREFTLVRSELRRGIDFILAAVSWALLPAVAILIWSQLAVTDGVRSALRNAVAGSVAMIPQGLVLVTSVAFAVGVVRLAQRRVLVQEMPAVEGLARVDVVCFDKTGTLTEGRLEHLATEPLAVADVDAVLAAMVETETNPNATIAALRPAYPNGPGWRQAGSVPFSSARKWSAVSFVGKGAFVIGAPDVLGVPQNLRSRVEKHASVGNRVLLLGSCPELPKADEPIGELEPLALVILGDKVRVDAPDTLEFFADQGVAVKVISGDHPATVGAIARLAGVPGADVVVDGRDLPADPALFADAVEKATVFGRISPRQKRAMIRALKLRGHVVAMSGDGVNDVLALKEADIGVAMGSGSDATKAVGQLVLVDGDFSALPRVVAEGRRVIANIERVANLYVTKTIYAFALVVAVGLAGFEFPFLPRHLTLVGSLTIGIPSFWLALEATGGRSEPGFVSRVFRFSIPTGLLAAMATFWA